MGDEIRHHPLELLLRRAAALIGEAKFDQAFRARADHGARTRERHRRDTLAFQHGIETADQIGGGVDQRSVEIEHCQERTRHGLSLAVRPVERKRRGGLFPARKQR